ncbi:hypothetical protein TNCV_478061 [Trichonephila clavipes]|nr:hypothetical protein TNCV_478001 [Trichonephila clavipes]GFV19580.1 hypothetical protein TNCV_478061 [Trichonephila clavipes]
MKNEVNGLMKKDTQALHGNPTMTGGLIAKRTLSQFTSEKWVDACLYSSRMNNEVNGEGHTGLVRQSNDDRWFDCKTDIIPSRMKNGSMRVCIHHE